MSRRLALLWRPVAWMRADSLRRNVSCAQALLLGETRDVLNTLGMVLMYEGKDQEAILYIERALKDSA